MPGYVKRALQRLQRQEPTTPENSPRKWSAPKRGAKGAKVQRAESDDATPALDASAKKRAQEITGTFLFYARAVDNATLKALGAPSPRQASPAEAAAGSVAQFLSCASTNPNAELHHVASDMILWIDSDASYLSEPKARPARGGHHFLSGGPVDPPKPPLPQHPEPTPNAPVHVLCSILREIASSAAEAEVGGLPRGGSQSAARRATMPLLRSMPLPRNEHKKSLAPSCFTLELLTTPCSKLEEPCRRGKLTPRKPPRAALPSSSTALPLIQVQNFTMLQAT